MKTISNSFRHTAILFAGLIIGFGFATKKSFSQNNRIWATYFGGAGFENIYSVDTDINGNVYIVGNTQSNSNLASGGFQNVYWGSTDNFLAKFSPAGALLWATYIGGSGTEWDCSVATDALGNVYVAGYTTSVNNIAAGGFQNINGGGNDAYLVKIDGATGARLWATYYGGAGDDFATFVAPDAAGNVYLSGRTSSTANIASGGFQNTHGGGTWDGFLVKFNATTGARIWATYYGDTGIDFGYCVTADAFGNVFLSGKTESTINIASGGFQNVHGGGGSEDAFLVKFDAAGNRVWATYYGGNMDDEGFSVATFGGNVYMAGRARSTTGIAAGGFQNALSGLSIDGFLVKFDIATGNRIWGTYYGGSLSEEIFNDALDIDASGNIFLAGDAYSTNTGNAIAINGHQNALVGAENMFLVMFDPNGNRICATYYGRNHEEIGCVAVDNSGNVYLGGATQSLFFIASGGFQNTHGGGTWDGFLVKFNSCSTVLSVSATSTNLLCYGLCTGTATANFANGTSPYSYSWNTSPVQTTQIATGLCAGTYTVTVTDATLATATAVVTITQPAAALTSSVTSSGTTCGNTNGTATVAASGGTTAYSYLWSPSGGTGSTANALAPGTYTVIVTDANGCKDTNTATIVTSNALSLSATSTPALCTALNGTATATPSGGTPNYSYVWSPSGGTAATASNLAPGTYTVTLTDGSGCTATATATVGQSSGTLTASATATPALCTVLNGTATATPSGGTPNYSYVWSPSGGTGATANGLAPGTYTVTISDASGCTITTTATVIQSSGTLTASATVTASICTSNNGTATATPSGGTAGYTYVWLPSGGTSTIASGLAPGTYTVTVTDVSGCTATASSIVTQSNGTLAATTAATPDLCGANNGTATATVTGGTAAYTYLWSPSGGTNATATGLAGGTYTVTVTDASGCTQVQTIVVPAIPGHNTISKSNVTIILNDSTILTASGGGTYSWTPAIGLSCTTCSNPVAKPVETTTYCVTVTDTNGCTSSACVTIEVEIPCPTNENLEVPNAFSPNKDGVNDDFCLQGWDACLEDFKIIIYDRWGEKVFESIDPNFCWDGKYLNTIMDAQVFVYYIKARYTEIENPIVKKGNISLIR